MWPFQVGLTLVCAIVAFLSFLMLFLSAGHEGDLRQAALGCMSLSIGLGMLINLERGAEDFGRKLLVRSAGTLVGFLALFFSVWMRPVEGFATYVQSASGLHYSRDEDGFKYPWERRLILPKGIQSTVLEVLVAGDSADSLTMAPTKARIGIFWEHDLAFLESRPPLCERIFQVRDMQSAIGEQLQLAQSPARSADSAEAHGRDLKKWENRCRARLREQLGVRQLGLVVLGS